MTQKICLEDQLFKMFQQNLAEKWKDSLNEFAHNHGGHGGDYLKALASAWYNDAFTTGSLQKGIKSKQDVERLLQRGIVCPDGKTRKYNIDYNANFDGVDIYSDDYYEHGDHDDTIDSRTGQKWGPYEHITFHDSQLDESQGVAEGQADQVKKVFKDKSGKPVGEIGIDPESSPGNGEWYVYHYATGYSVVGFDSAAEAKRELMYVHKHPEAVEGHPSTKEQGVAEEYKGNVKDTELKNVDPANHSQGEGDFVKNQLHTMKRVITHLDNAIGRGEDLPDWVQSEIAQAADKIIGVMDYSISSKEQDIEKHSGGSALMKEDWNKVNHHDHTNGLSQKAVNSYRHEHPGSKLKTAVTTKPSKLKAGSKDANRRKSFCARMSGNEGPMKKPNGKPTPKALALRRWHCESVDYKALQDLSSRLEDLWEGAFKQIDIDRQEREQSNIFEVGRYKDGYWVPLKHHAGHEQAHFHAKSLKKKYPSMEIGVKSQDGQVELIGVGETTGNNTMAPWSDSGAKFKQMESDTMNKNYPFAGKAVGQKAGKAGQLKGKDAGKLGGKQPAQGKLVGGA